MFPYPQPIAVAMANLDEFKTSTTPTDTRRVTGRSASLPRSCETPSGPATCRHAT
jgi:hypothetical protein